MYERGCPSNLQGGEWAGSDLEIVEHVAVAAHTADGSIGTATPRKIATKNTWIYKT